MADKGPKRSDFQESSKLPACGPGCEVEHGDQADPEQLELMHLRAEVKHLRSTSQELEIDRLRQESARFRRIAEDNGAVQAAAMVEISRLRQDLEKTEKVARELHTDRDQLWALSEDRGRLVEGYRAETDRLRAELAAKPDPEGGAAAKRELEWMRPKLAEAETALERAQKRAGWGFLGPCVHGRDPFDRCDTCGELEPYQAAQLVEREAGAAFLELNAGNATLDTTGVERKTLFMAARLLRERGGGA